MWFTLAIMAVLVLLVLRRARYADGPKKTLNPALLIVDAGKLFAAALVAAFFLTFIQDTVVLVPAGQRGVVFDVFKGVKPQPLREGWNFILPFVQRVTLINVRLQKVAFDADAASKDLQTVKTKVAVNIHPLPDEVSALFREIGVDYVDKIVHPAVQEVLKASTALYTAEELIVKREKVKQDIHDGLLKILLPARIQLLETFITDFKFGQEFEHAIEQKQVAQQEALKASRDLERIRIEAEQQIARARAEAESLRMQREAITPQLLDLRRIDMQKAAIAKWNGRMPEVVQGGGTPFVDLSVVGAKSRPEGGP